MGRSVSYLTGATKVAYFDVGYMKDEFDWQCFEENITYSLRKQFKSLEDADKWDGRETKIILQNSFVEIGISEYCSLASVSVRINDDAIDNGQQGLAERFIGAVERKLEEMSELTKSGTFSNGEGVYERKTNNSSVHSGTTGN